MNASPARPRIAMLYGGASSEHDVSMMSATNVIAAIDPARYDVLPVFIARDGRWREGSYGAGRLSSPSDGADICFVPGGGGRVLAVGADGAARDLGTVDAVFPVLHGLNGEDGSVQGLAAVAGVPLVGCGLLGSANALDKDIAKRLLGEAGVPVARSVTVEAGSVPGFDTVAAELGTPVFVKPARQGSSVGVSKAATAGEFTKAVAEGFSHDAKLVIEEFVRAREIECSVLEAPDGSLFVSRPGEIVPAESHGFYSYDAKYVDADGAALIVPASLPEDVEAAIRETAALAFRAVGCDAMARVDFFVTDDMRFLVNELNTIPGFTNISMYPKAMAASGVGYAELIDRLIAHGLARAARQG